MLFRVTVLSAFLLFYANCTVALPASALQHRRQSSFNASLIPPSQDPFYLLPANLSDYPKGAIIRERKVPDSYTIFGSEAGDTYQLLFRTNGVHMKPDAAVTTVVAPLQPVEGPPKVVAIASAVDSPAVDCALSWALYPYSASLEREKGKTPSFTILAKGALHQGYYVTLPDQEGSKAAWGAYSEGQVVLDSILAIINHRATIANSSGYQAALAGYSGGGHGAAWAGQLASTYGKGIPIVALAAGGIPVDFAASLTFLDSKIGAGFAFSGIAGLANVYPDYNQYIMNTFKPNGTAAFLAVKDGSHCLQQTVFKFAFKSVFGSMTDRNFLNSPTSKIALDESFLGKHQDPITDFPIYQIHSQVDDIVIYQPALDYYNSQCSKGAKIVFSNPTSGKHLMTQTKAAPSQIYFIKSIFEGTMKVSECRQSTDYLIPFDGPDAISTVGKPIIDELKSLARKYTVSDWVEGL